MQADRPLIELVTEQLESESLNLPVYSPVASRIQSLASNDDAPIEEIERQIVVDPALASHVLKVANSPMYAGLARINSIKGAMLRIGTQQVVNLAVMCAQKSNFQTSQPNLSKLMAKIWKHSVACALASKWLAERTGRKELVNDAFMAGLFHDIGQLLVIKAVEDCQAIPGAQRLPGTLIMELLDSAHAEQGAKLIGRWNLPDKFALIAQTHDCEQVAEGDDLELIVRLANNVCTRLGLDIKHEPELSLASSEEAGALGVNDLTLAELEIHLEDGIAQAA